MNLTGHRRLAYRCISLAATSSPSPPPARGYAFFAGAHYSEFLKGLSAAPIASWSRELLSIASHLRSALPTDYHDVQRRYLQSIAGFTLRQQRNCRWKKMDVKKRKWTIF
ncbi:hypothetical protein FA13DRAFT_1740804 [Coprinellus micaceus]|uniref:Uncharacterized protein n=1 Tax=Coprinellus micaceus TaxID=71717 RepID=A0A4Y7SLW7_COPMI|nr:hypothetical protein FA13DRAFT_1740804 [Coprinellus micaceus]